MLQYDSVFVDNGQASGTEICDIPVVSGIADLLKLRKDYSLLVVSIRTNRFRERCTRKKKRLVLSSRISLRRVSISAILQRYVKVVFCCKILVSRMAQLWVTESC